MTTAIKYVLLLINEEAHIRELARLASVLLETEDLRPVVFLEDRLKHRGPPGTFTQLGIEVLTSDDVSVGEPPSSVAGVQWTPQRRKSRRTAVAVDGLLRLAPPKVGGPLSWARDFADYIAINRSVMLRRAAVAEAILTRQRFAALVMSEDNVELDTGVWIAVARGKGIRSVIVPYTISNTAEFAESYVGEKAHRVQSSIHNRAVARLFPQWVLAYKGHRLVRSRYAKVFAVEQLGLTPPDPWLLNSGYADAIAVESEAMLDYYRAAGIVDSQLIVTGSLADDLIASCRTDVAERRRSLLEPFGLVDDRPLLLCALPPDQNTYDRPGCEFRDFDDLLSFWGERLAAVGGWNVMVRPHPKTAPERVESLQRLGLAVTYQDTASLVPLCDLYVASISATIRWAVACGKPVINYDVYRYGYQDFRGLEAVVPADTRSQFSDLLNRLTTDPAMLAETAKVQSLDARRWGTFDGGAARRMVALLRGDTVRPAFH